MKIPFLKNFRRGFATNSSSSHSFVYMKKDQPQSGDVMDNDFGWKDFRLDSIKQKLFYALVSRVDSYKWGTPTEEEVDEAVQEYGDDYPELDREDFRYALEGGVDHESRGLISRFEARDPRLVVFGGNDNEGPSQERIKAIVNDEVDWTRTDMLYEDVQFFNEDDQSAWDALKRAGLENYRKRKPQRNARKLSKLYHITPSGEPGLCTATLKSCPYGGAGDHYTSKEAARAAFEDAMENN